MVEGPGVHRVANAHRGLLVGKVFDAVSPNQRFKDGASAIAGKCLQKVEAHGKNLFHFYGPTGSQQADTVVWMHFGMSGHFRVHKLPGPEPTAATRLRLEAKAEGVGAHLSCMSCAYGGLDFYSDKVGKLGPDPLRSDADRDVVWARLQKSKKTLGACLMDQSLVAGIGNIYRTELLFAVGVHPDTPAREVSRATFDVLWEKAVQLMAIGVTSGSIITVLGADGKANRGGDSRYVYARETCLMCRSPVSAWSVAARTVYACLKCQPLSAAIDRVPSRSIEEKSRRKRAAQAVEAHERAQEEKESQALTAALAPKTPEAKVARRPSTRVTRSTRASIAAVATLAAGANGTTKGSTKVARTLEVSLQEADTLPVGEGGPEIAPAIVEGDASKKRRGGKRKVGK